MVSKKNYLEVKNGQSVCTVFCWGFDTSVNLPFVYSVCKFGSFWLILSCNICFGFQKKVAL